MIFLEQIGFVLRMCELFDSSKNIETTQSREKFITAHLALRISLLVCVGKYSLSSCYLELENIYMFIFMCIDRYLKLTAGIRSCSSQNQGSLQARKEQEMALGLFSDLWACVGFYLENLLSFRLCKRMKRLFRHGGVFWGPGGGTAEDGRGGAGRMRGRAGTPRYPRLQLIWDTGGVGTLRFQAVAARPRS